MDEITRAPIQTSDLCFHLVCILLNALEMMAVSSSKNVANEEEKSKFCRSSNHSPEKRITPFSIDDILAKSQNRKRKASKDEDKGSNPTSFVQSPFDLPLDPSGKVGLWNPESYARWIESLQRLCAATALQPFWFPEYRPRPSLFGRDFRLSNLSGLHQIRENKPQANPGKFPNNFSQHRRRSSDECKSEPEKSRSDTSGEFCRFRGESRLAARRSLERQFVNGADRRSPSTSLDSDDGVKRIEAKDGDRSKSESPLSALEKLTCVTFKGMEEKQHELHAVAAGREARAKRRKCRTAFTAFQLSVLEQRFNCHKYLTPTDRDQIAHILGLSAPQVITWFQNRRAKLKRDLEEMRNDIKTVKKWAEPSGENSSPGEKVTSGDEKMEVERSPR